MSLNLNAFFLLVLFACLALFGCVQETPSSSTSTTRVTTTSIEKTTTTAIIPSEDLSKLALTELDSGSTNSSAYYINNSKTYSMSGIILPSEDIDKKLISWGFIQVYRVGLQIGDNAFVHQDLEQYSLGEGAIKSFNDANQSANARKIPLANVPTGKEFGERILVFNLSQKDLGDLYRSQYSVIFVKSNFRSIILYTQYSKIPEYDFDYSEAIRYAQIAYGKLSD
ncbi:hypothetical protein HY991_05110 [Candidatus Micrarchaeota archaeon]|nr:hypothetical protein [Candidatus Micrarchaeota archaeon]